MKHKQTGNQTFAKMEKMRPDSAIVMTVYANLGHFFLRTTNALRSRENSKRNSDTYLELCKIFQIHMLIPYCEKYKARLFCFRAELRLKKDLPSPFT